MTTDYQAEARIISNFPSSAFSGKLVMEKCAVTFGGARINQIRGTDGRLGPFPMSLRAASRRGEPFPSIRRYLRPAFRVIAESRDSSQAISETLPALGHARLKPEQDS